MAEDENKNGTSGTQPPQPDKLPQINVIGQYIKDLSFENPDAVRLLRNPGKNPGLQINFNVQVRSIGDDSFEVTLAIEGEAKSDLGLLYKFEVVYAGAFLLKNLPKEAVQPVLYIECPALLFPFVRRLIADLSREAGYPPLLLDPIDFATLYRRRMAKGEQTAVA